PAAAHRSLPAGWRRRRRTERARRFRARRRPGLRRPTSETDASTPPPVRLYVDSTQAGNDLERSIGNLAATGEPWLLLALCPSGHLGAVRALPAPSTEPPR